MEPTATSDNSDAAEYQARLACERRCAVLGHCVCTAWRNFLPGGDFDFDVVAEPTDAAERLRAATGMRRVDLPMAGAGFSFVEAEPAVEAPRPPALPEHPAIEITLALRRASAMDRQRRIAAQLLVDLGVSDQTFDDAARRHDMELGGVGFHESREGILGAEARAVFDAVLAEILA